MSADPYRYFRIEARELLDGLGAGVLALEGGGAQPALVARLLRLAHTLKGAARVVRRPDIAQLAHGIEDLLDGHRALGGPLPPEQVTELLRLVDGIAAEVRTLEQPAAPVASAPAASAPAAAAAPADELLETVRVEIAELDVLLHGVAEVGTRLGKLRRDVGGAGHLAELARLLAEHLEPRRGAAAAASATRARALADQLRGGLARLHGDLVGAVDHVATELGALRDVSHQLRLVPASSVFPVLARTARDAAAATGRRVELDTVGGEVRLDADVLAGLREALMHLVRNAVAHGLEPEAARLAAGKPAIGRIHIEVERDVGRVRFRCRDDGRGFDTAAIRRAAIEHGRVTPEAAAALGADQLHRLLLGGGLSTQEQVTAIAGRGVGLDVARATAQRLKGEVAIASEPGRGATVELRVPVSIASMTSLRVEAGGAIAAIPIDAVRRTLRLRGDDLAHGAGGDAVVVDGEVVPLLALAAALRGPGARVAAPAAWSVVIVEAGQRSVAVGVDRLLGTAHVVVRPMPAAAEAAAIIAGVSIDDEGRPELVLDPASLVAAAERGEGRIDVAPGVIAAPILVVDDSLTTRMLEQSILESAGYAVDVAVSAEEALDKCRARRYRLFVVDVEMPGMDGFEFVTRTRADAELRDIPAILVTSRNSPEDRRRGERAGAGAYIVKSEFDQGRLLQTIRSLLS